ncbi:hypothetical protein [Treponema endosymbiont of Eucomonympha sp.]|uniref:hypothetical protein n=1 Tax=Treponema endosymbiont of Eucomonympha sp. TaxID=1580831 RepID=UPI00078627F8|nr:hypothetical protein [Treponema endosymbiont of Eucomonympha sp.]
MRRNGGAYSAARLKLSLAAAERFYRAPRQPCARKPPRIPLGKHSRSYSYYGSMPPFGIGGALKDFLSRVYYA